MSNFKGKRWQAFVVLFSVAFCLCVATLLHVQADVIRPTATSTILSAGWNFISLPKQPSNTTTEAILADVSPSIRIVWGYDNEHKVWKRHKPGETANANVLSNMEAGKGYWIYANNEKAINMTGCTDPSSSVHLYEGWNLVGYSGTDNNDIVAVLDAISDKWSLIWNWDKGAWKANKGPDINAELFVPELTTFNTGKAYWIRTRAGQAADWVQAGTTPPGAPTGLMAAEVSGNQINLSWADASGNVGVAGYYVYQGTTRIADVKATSYSITNFDANAQSSYIIRAYDASRNISASSALLVVGGGSNTLTAAASGTGSGTITSVPAGINCGSICSVTIIKGTSVTLTATPNADSFFAGWSGACTGTGACLATIDEAKKVTATFNSSPLLLTIPVTTAIPLTSLQVTASGLIQDASVSVSFSNNSGFSVKDDPIRVGDDGAIVVAVPLYIESGTHEITAGTVDVVITQGTRSSPPVTLSIQDLPPLSAFGTRLGEISKAYLNFSGMQLGRRGQRLQVGEVLSGGTIDTSAARAIISDLLKKSVAVRYDVDRIFLDNGVVIDGGTLLDGTPAQFNKDSVEMMDRILGVWLSQQFGGVISPVGIQSKSATGVTSSTRGPQQLYPQVVSISPDTIKAVMDGVGGLTTGIDMMTDLIKKTDHPFIDPAMGIIKGAQGFTSLIGETPFTKRLGAYLALYDIGRAGMDVGFDLLELYGFGITDGGETYDRLQKDSDELLKTCTKALLDPTKDAFKATENSITALKLLWAYSDFASTTEQTIMRDATTKALGTYSPSSSVGQVSGVVNGIQQGPSTPSVSVDLCCFGSEALGISGIADPSGNYGLLMPRGVPNTDYARLTIKAADSMTGQVHGSKVVDLTNLDPNTPINISSCTYDLSSTSQPFDSHEGTGSIGVTAQSGCTWASASNTNWITVTSGSSGTGNGTVGYSVSANTSTNSRTGSITIAGKTFTVTQSPAYPFQGSLSGNWWSETCTYGYTTSGGFSINIDANGNVSGSFNGSTSGSISGTVNNSGNYSAGGGSAGGYSWSGTITSSGGSLSGSGSWNGSESGITCSGKWSGPG